MAVAFGVSTIPSRLGRRLIQAGKGFECAFFDVDPRFIMLVTFLVALIAIASGETVLPPQRWVTDILYDTLETYTPDGGSMCKRDGQAYREGLKNLQLWATRMYDASVKFPTGILSGKSYNFGDYDECLDTDTSGLDFKTQYCIVNIQFSPFFKLYPNYYNTTPPKLSPSVSAWEAVKSYHNPVMTQRNEINTAICIPSSCTHSDLQSTLSAKIMSTFNELEINTTVNVNPLYCTTQNAEPPITLGFILFWCFLIIIVMLIIVGSMFDLYSKGDGKINYKSFFVAFSLQSNVNKLLQNNNSEFAGVNFIRFLSCVVILFGHRMLVYAAYPIYNVKTTERTFENVFSGILQNGPSVVDNFFTISGFLTFLSISKLLKNKQFNIPLLLFYRWCRLIPVYGVIIAFNAFVFVHLSDGPLWNSVAFRESENCLKNWWTNILFINNYVDSEHPCVMQSWYLACDLHMCALGMILMYFMWKYSKCEKPVLFIAIFASSFVSAYVVYRHKFYPTYIGFVSALHYPPSQEAFRLSYVPTHTRLAPYFVGMYAATIYRDIKANRPDFRFPRPALLLSTVFSSYLVFMVPIAYFYQNEYNLWASVVYAFVYRLVFAAIVSAFMIISTVNGFFRGSCAHILASMSRLTYAAYLGGISTQLFQAASTRTPTYFSLSQISWLTMGDITHALIVAFFLYVMIESPFANLLNRVFYRTKKEEHKAVNIEMSPQNT